MDERETTGDLDGVLLVHPEGDKELVCVSELPALAERSLVKVTMGEGEEDDEAEEEVEAQAEIDVMIEGLVEALVELSGLSVRTVDGVGVTETVLDQRGEPELLIVTVCVVDVVEDTENTAVREPERVALGEKLERLDRVLETDVVAVTKPVLETLMLPVGDMVDDPLADIDDVIVTCAVGEDVGDTDIELLTDVDPVTDALDDILTLPELETSADDVAAALAVAHDDSHELPVIDSVAVTVGEIEGEEDEDTENVEVGEPVRLTVGDRVRMAVAVYVLIPVIELETVDEEETHDVADVLGDDVPVIELVVVIEAVPECVEQDVAETEGEAVADMVIDGVGVSELEDESESKEEVDADGEGDTDAVKAAETVESAERVEQPVEEAVILGLIDGERVVEEECEFVTDAETLRVFNDERDARLVVEDVIEVVGLEEGDRDAIELTERLLLGEVLLDSVGEADPLGNDEPERDGEDEPVGVTETLLDTVAEALTLTVCRGDEETETLGVSDAVTEGKFVGEVQGDADVLLEPVWVRESIGETVDETVPLPDLLDKKDAVKMGEKVADTESVRRVDEVTVVVTQADTETLVEGDFVTLTLTVAVAHIVIVAVCDTVGEREAVEQLLADAEPEGEVVTLTDEVTDPVLVVEAVIVRTPVTEAVADTTEEGEDEPEVDEETDGEPLELPELEGDFVGKAVADTVMERLLVAVTVLEADLVMFELTVEDGVIDVHPDAESVPLADAVVDVVALKVWVPDGDTDGVCVVFTLTV